MSRSAFAKKFSDAYGDGPMKFLRQLRMNKAAELLQNTEHSIKIIAAKSGFQSRSAFSLTFENHYGCAPRSFRIEHNKKGH